MVRPTWGAVVTVRDHVYKGASQCLLHDRLLINDSSWHHRDTPAPPPAEGCDAWGDHPNLVYLFTHILGEVRKHLVRGGLGPEQLLACASPVPPLPSVSEGILSQRKSGNQGATLFTVLTGFFIWIVETHCMVGLSLERGLSNFEAG